MGKEIKVLGYKDVVLTSSTERLNFILNQNTVVTGGFLESLDGKIPGYNTKSWNVVSDGYTTFWALEFILEGEKRILAACLWDKTKPTTSVHTRGQVPPQEIQIALDQLANRLVNKASSA